jgi:uncharacterized membrane protein
MASASNSITINRPASDIYQFLADGLNNPKWRSAVVGINLASGAKGAVGAVYKQTLKGPFGSKVAGDYRIVEAVPNSRIKFEVITGPARPVGQFDIEPALGAATVRFSLSFAPTGFMRLMNGMIQSTMEAEVKNLSALKTLLEAK